MVKRSITSAPTIFRDGSQVLTGFILSEKPVMEDAIFPLPGIPPGWKPDPQRVWEADKENIPKREVQQAPMPHGKWKSSAMSATEVCVATFQC